MSKIQVDLGLKKYIFKAIVMSFKKLDPRVQIQNFVIFLVYLGTIAVTIINIIQVFRGESPGNLSWHLIVWLWFTVLFANFAEAVAEIQGKARAESLRGLREGIKAKKILGNGAFVIVSGHELKSGDLVECNKGDIIPSDGAVVEGIALVDESAVTGESAPVIREAGSDLSSVTGGTKVLSDRIVIRVEHNAGEGFIDRMIKMVEQSKRRPTPGEIALKILLAVLSVIFIVATFSLVPFVNFLESQGANGALLSVTTLVALLVCLIPTTIGGLLSAIGISGISRLMSKNVLALSGRAVEASGDVDVLLVDKTGTITHGNRQAIRLIEAPGVARFDLVQAAYLASLGDETPEGRSIIKLIENEVKDSGDIATKQAYQIVPFGAETKMSGLDFELKDNPNPYSKIRKGAMLSVKAWVESCGLTFPREVESACNEVANQGGTPLAVACENQVLGLIHLKDIVKDNIKERFERLHELGIRTIMITGDNSLTARVIAIESGVSDFVAEAKPETKLKAIRAEQEKGHLVAMMGDGTNDAPALAQADVGIAMASGTSTAREAGNMIDFDNDPTKLLQVVETGKQLLITRGALTTFSMANDIAKYFAIIPALFLGLYSAAGSKAGPLAVLNIMGLSSPQSAILSAVIFNALIIVLLIPLALRGVGFTPKNPASILRRNLLVYGLGGIVAPFLGIKLIDMALSLLGISL